jgi:hypothetical protein
MTPAEKFLTEVKARAEKATLSDGSRMEIGWLHAMVARIRRTLHGGLPDLLTSEKADLIQVIEQYRAARTDVDRLVEMVEAARKALIVLDNPPWCLALAEDALRELDRIAGEDGT